jgi:N-acetyl-gamma-glutamylphosphate reductase
VSDNDFRPEEMELYEKYYKVTKEVDYLRHKGDL